MVVCECDFYMNIFDDFLLAKNDENQKIMWKMRTIIDLMKITNGQDDNGFMENALRMIMLISNHYIMTPCELERNYFVNAPFDEKEELKTVLKEEFIRSL
ncbi:hypothetical protein ES705_32768 [subsurface metagenome]